MDFILHTSRSYKIIPVFCQYCNWYRISRIFYLTQVLVASSNLLLRMLYCTGKFRSNNTFAIDWIIPLNTELWTRSQSFNQNTLTILCKNQNSKFSSYQLLLCHPVQHYNILFLPSLAFNIHWEGLALIFGCLKVHLMQSQDCSICYTCIVGSHIVNFEV